MKRGLIILLVPLFIFSFPMVLSVSSSDCQLSVQLLNQDPYPAVPGDYVKLVFQINGLENPACGAATFELLEKYPLKFDPNTTRKISFDAGTFTKDYSGSLTAAYKVRVDPEAVIGDNPIEVQYSSNGMPNTFLSKQFNLSVKDAQANFEVFVKDYNYATGILSLEILNYGKSKAQAILVEIPKQEKINLTGANKNLAGDLDSNEYTSADFTASPSDGSIQILISYTDSAGIRRSVVKQVEFDSSYFSNTKVASGKFSWMNIIIVLVVLFIAYYIFRRYRKKSK